MGSPYSIRTRARGTGSVTRTNGRYWARKPIESGQHEGELLGKFDSAWQAHRALDRWLAERSAKVA